MTGSPIWIYGSRHHWFDIRLSDDDIAATGVGQRRPRSPVAPRIFDIAFEAKPKLTQRDDCRQACRKWSKVPSGRQASFAAGTKWPAVMVTRVSSRASCQPKTCRTWRTVRQRICVEPLGVPSRDEHWPDSPRFHLGLGQPGRVTRLATCCVPGRRPGGAVHRNAQLAEQVGESRRPAEDSEIMMMRWWNWRRPGVPFATPVFGKPRRGNQGMLGLAGYAESGQMLCRRSHRRGLRAPGDGRLHARTEAAPPGR